MDQKVRQILKMCPPPPPDGPGGGGGDIFLLFGERGGPSKVVHLQFQAGGQTFENSLMLDPIQSFV